MKTFDVIVLGVGGMGSAACYHLAKRGLKTLGIEQFQIAHDQGSSHGETRIIRRAYFEHPNYVPLLNRSYELWKDLENESGEKLFIQNGLVIYGNPETSSIYKGTLESAQKYNVDIQCLSRNEALGRYPYFNPPPGSAAILEPGAGFLCPEKSIQAHVALAKKFGAEIHEREKVIRYHAHSDSVTVVTHRETYHAKKLVIAGGGWNAHLLQDLKLSLSLKGMILYWFEAEKDYSLESGVPCFAFHMNQNFFYGFPMLDGKTIKMGAHFTHRDITEPEQKNMTAVPVDQLVEIQNFVREALPKASLRLSKFASCLYTMTPDENFILDLHPKHPPISIAAGFSGHGFKFSSVVGEIMADLAIDGITQQPIKFLRIR